MTYVFVTEWMEKEEREKYDRELPLPPNTRTHARKSTGTDALMAAFSMRQV